MKLAKDMTTVDIETELVALSARIDDFEKSEVSGGGSPGESMYERHEELTRELSRRDYGKTFY